MTKKIISLVIVMSIILLSTGCAPVNKTDYLRSKKGGIRGIFEGDVIEGGGAGAAHVPGTKGASPENTEITNNQDGINKSNVETITVNSDVEGCNKDRNNNSRSGGKKGKSMHKNRVLN